MRDVALITATIEKARQAEVSRLTANGISPETIREVDAGIRNVAQAVMLLASPERPERPLYFNH